MKIRTLFVGGRVSARGVGRGVRGRRKGRREKGEGRYKLLVKRRPKR